MSFAPSSPDWGYDNRAAGVRLPQTEGPAARLEHRISGADVNPYLVLTAILGGILHGIDTDPTCRCRSTIRGPRRRRRLATTGSTAVDRFAASDHAAEVFGETYRHVYAAVKNDEVQTLTGLITPVEYRYLPEPPVTDAPPDMRPMAYGPLPDAGGFWPTAVAVDPRPCAAAGCGDGRCGRDGRGGDRPQRRAALAEAGRDVVVLEAGSPAGGPRAATVGSVALAGRKPRPRRC